MLEAYGYDRVLAGGFMSVFAIAGLTLSLRVARGLARRGLWPWLAGAFAVFLGGEALALAAPGSGVVMLVARGLEGIGFTVCAIAGPLLVNMNASRRDLPFVVGLSAAWIPIGQVSANLVSFPAVGRGLWQPLWWVGIALTMVLALWALAARRSRSAHFEMRGHGGGGGVPATPAQRRALVIAAGIFGLWSGQYFAYMTWLPQFLVERHGFGAGGAVLAYTVPAAMVLVFCVVTGAILRAGVPLAPLFAGSVAVQVAVWFLAPVTGNGITGVLSLMAYGITAGITPVCLFAMPSAIMGAGRADAHAFGTIMTGRNLGVLGGPVILAWAVTVAPGWHTVWPLFGGVSVVVLVGALDLARRLRALAREAQGASR
jgi:MFS family permease